MHAGSIIYPAPWISLKELAIASSHHPGSRKLTQQRILEAEERVSLFRSHCSCVYGGLKACVDRLEWERRKCFAGGGVRLYGGEGGGVSPAGENLKAFCSGCKKGRRQRSADITQQPPRHHPSLLCRRKLLNKQSYQIRVSSVSCKMSEDNIIQAAETIQTASINPPPHSPQTGVNPKASRFHRVPSVSDAGSFSTDTVDPSRTVSSLPRRPPLPDLRFEQSYLASLRGAETWGRVAWITIRDQAS